MSTVLESKPQPGQNIAEISRKLDFQRQLQAVTNKIHATANVDEIMLEVSQEICDLFEADRLTIYTLAEDKGSIVSKVKTGLSSFKDLKLPINEQSVAGFVAAHKRLVNIRDVYDEEELRGLSLQLKFLKEVDRRTGYRTKQMLVVPILEAGSNELIGVVQIINAKEADTFGPPSEEGAVNLCETLAIALKQRQKPAQSLRGKYDGLVTNAILSSEEIELATRSARRKNLDIEDVLIDEFQVKPQAIGEAIAAFFGVAYEPFRADRIKPVDLLRNLKRDFVESSGWLPLEEGKDGLLVITTDPERLRASRMVSNIFPRAKAQYAVTTQREFRTTVDQFFGGGGGSSSEEFVADVGELLNKLDDESDLDLGAASDDVTLAQDNELVRLVNKIIVDAYHQGASDIHIEPFPGKGKTEVRFRKDGTLVPYISVPSSYRNALAARLKIMCDLDISASRRSPRRAASKIS
jgi:hypothetical protein